MEQYITYVVEGSDISNIMWHQIRTNKVTLSKIHLDLL